MFDYLSKMRKVLDFPKPGILFYDVTSLFSDPDILRELKRDTITLVPEWTTKIIAIEARGFIIGSMMSCATGLPLFLARKPGKLPVETDSATYNLEYGTDSICLEKNVINENDHVLIADDLLATGGTISAVSSIVRKYNPMSVSAAVWIELRTEGLRGREFLHDHNISVNSLIKAEDNGQ